MNKTELGVTPIQAADLNLFLYDRPLHPELFRIYSDHRVEQGKYYANVWIVGLGHVVSINKNGRSLTELICRDSDVLPSRGVLTRFRLKGERDQDRRVDGWVYMASTQIETMDEALYKSVHVDLVRHAGKRGWFHQYDSWADGELAPFSYVDHEARDAEFHVHAFHAFPAERTIVKTQTIFEIPG